MAEGVLQGDIIKVEKIKFPVLVVSKDFFNESGEVIGCPIYMESTKSPLHIWIQTESMVGYVQCEKLALLDLSVRGHSKIDKVTMEDRINIADVAQGIFDYI